MTIKLGYTDGTKASELEVIRAFAGVEKSRERIRDGQETFIGLDGSTTLTIRTVPAEIEASPLTPAQQALAGHVDASDPGLVGEPALFPHGHEESDDDEVVIVAGGEGGGGGASGSFEDTAGDSEGGSSD